MERELRRLACQGDDAGDEQRRERDQREARDAREHEHGQIEREQRADRDQEREREQVEEVRGALAEIGARRPRARRRLCGGGGAGTEDDRSARRVQVDLRNGRVRDAVGALAERGKRDAQLTGLGAGLDGGRIALDPARIENLDVGQCR